MNTYEQSSGVLRDATGANIGLAYAGYRIGKNNPAFESVANTGPLPSGFYTIEAPVNHPHLGPYALALTPAETNRMHGRSAFYIHGDSSSHPGEASDGCIIADRATRERIWTSGDRQLQVIP